jgi:hypothetical protein
VVIDACSILGRAEKLEKGLTCLSDVLDATTGAETDGEDPLVVWTGALVVVCGYRFVTLIKVSPIIPIGVVGSYAL